MNVAPILRKIMEVSGLKQAGLASKVRVSQGTISKWMNGDHSPNTEQWARVVAFANRYPALRDVVKTGTISGGVPIMGYIGAGAEISPEFEQVPPEGLEQVELPFDVPSEIVAFRVRGDSMRPAYRDGDVVLVWERQRGAPESYFGEEVAVRTFQGHRYLKEIQPGERRGTYNLSSHNAKVIPNVRLEWVGEIYLTIRANQVKNLKKSTSTHRAAAAR